MTVIKPQFAVLEPALSASTLSELDAVLAPLGLQKVSEHYSEVTWKGVVCGGRVTFKAYPSAKGQRTVQSYFQRIGLGGLPVNKLFDNFLIFTTEDEDNRLLGKPAVSVA